MNKFLIAFLVLALFAMPVFAAHWSVGLGGGYPAAGAVGKVEFDSHVSIEAMLGVDYTQSRPVSGELEAFGAYNFHLAEALSLRAGLGFISRLGVQGNTIYFDAFPAALVGFDFPIPNWKVTPFVKGNIGYNFYNKSPYWAATAGLRYCI